MSVAIPLYNPCLLSKLFCPLNVHHSYPSVLLAPPLQSFPNLSEAPVLPDLNVHIPPITMLSSSPQWAASPELTPCSYTESFIYWMLRMWYSANFIITINSFMIRNTILMFLILITMTCTHTKQTLLLKRKASAGYLMMGLSVKVPRESSLAGWVAQKILGISCSLLNHFFTHNTKTSSPLYHYKSLLTTGFPSAFSSSDRERRRRFQFYRMLSIM